MHLNVMHLNARLSVYCNGKTSESLCCLLPSALRPRVNARGGQKTKRVEVTQPDIVARYNST